MEQICSSLFRVQLIIYLWWMLLCLCLINTITNRECYTYTIPYIDNTYREPCIFSLCILYRLLPFWCLQCRLLVLDGNIFHYFIRILFMIFFFFLPQSVCAFIFSNCENNSIFSSHPLTILSLCLKLLFRLSDAWCLCTVHFCAFSSFVFV